MSFKCKIEFKFYASHLMIGSSTFLVKSSWFFRGVFKTQLYILDKDLFAQIYSQKNILLIRLRSLNKHFTGNWLKVLLVTG